MQGQGFEKQMFSTNRRQKIFNVRKVPYKQFDNEKYLKSNFSPFRKQNANQPVSSTQARKGDYDFQCKKGGEYNFQVAIISSQAYKDLNKKYHLLKEEQAAERQRRSTALKMKQTELQKYRADRQRLEGEREKLQKRRDELRAKIEEIRERNQAMRAEQAQRSILLADADEEYRLMNMEYLRNMIMGMRFQNGVQIDPDNMTYEELLQLEEKMGSVCKGFTQEQLAEIPVRTLQAGEQEQLCSICYYNAKEGEQINSLPCSHTFHSDCIREWLLKERVCPLCKQQITLNSKKGEQAKPVSMKRDLGSNEGNQSIDLSAIQ